MATGTVRALEKKKDILNQGSPFDTTQTAPVCTHSEKIHLCPLCVEEESIVDEELEQLSSAETANSNLPTWHFIFTGSSGAYIRWGCSWL